MQVIDFIYPEKSEVKYRIDTYPDSQSHLQIAYLFAARTDRLFSFNEALDLELVGKCLTFVQAQITSVIEPHSSRLISDGIILPNLQKYFQIIFMVRIILCSSQYIVLKNIEFQRINWR